MTLNIRPDCAVIVSSCDAYADVWEPFFTLFFRYWPDCPFPIYLISNEKIYPDTRVTTLRVGPDKGWATNTQEALGRITTPYILWIVEDLFLEKSTDTDHVVRLLEYLKERHAATVRLFPSPPPDTTFPNALDIGVMSNHADYRVSLLAGLWDKEIFISLIREGETAWQMEIDGTERSRSLDAEFFSAQRPVLHFLERTMIVRGKWMYEAVKLCRREHVPLNLSRGVAYGRYWLSWADITRKQPWARWVRKVPILGGIIRTCYAFVRQKLR